MPLVGALVAALVTLTGGFAMLAGGIEPGSRGMLVDLRIWDLEGQLLFSTLESDNETLAENVRLGAGENGFVMPRSLAPRSLRIGEDGIFRYRDSDFRRSQSDAEWLEEGMGASGFRGFREVYPRELGFRGNMEIERHRGPYPRTVTFDASLFDNGAAKLEGLGYRSPADFYVAARTAESVHVAITRLGSVRLPGINMPVTMLPAGDDGFIVRLDPEVGQLIPANVCQQLGIPTGFYRVEKVSDATIGLSVADVVYPQLLGRQLVVEVTPHVAT